MKSTELREKLAKAQEKVEKIKKTIERHYAGAEKKKAIIEKNGWEMDRYLYRDGEHEDAYWTICEYENKISDAHSAEKKLKEAEQVVQNWQDKLDRQLEVERKLQTEIPEAFREAKEYLVANWVTCDIAERERIKALRAEIDKKWGDDWRSAHKEYRDKVSYSHEMAFQKTEEEFRKMEEREAEAWLLDLYNRVYAITGKITDASGIRWGGKCLDGYVVGENGKAVVETIGAGGYNIVRYHLRTLVKEYK